MRVGESLNKSREIALESTYRQHAVWLRSKVVKYLRSQHPDDLVQEAFLRLATRYPDIGLRHPRALLYRIALNLWRTSMRREQLSASVIFAQDYPPSGPVSKAEQFEVVLLKQMVLKLPKNYRDVFILSRFSGMSYAEIAVARGISEKTVEWRMARALKLCADKLRE